VQLTFEIPDSLVARTAMRAQAYMAVAAYWLVGNQSWGEGEAVEAGLVFKGLEFDTFKVGIVDLFPNTDEFKGVTVTHPTVDQDIIPEFFRHIGEGDEVLAALRDDGDGRALDFDVGAFGFTHGVG